MGEIADMMLEGFLDEETGELIDGSAPGFPRRLSDPDCYLDYKIPVHRHTKRPLRPKTIPCPNCKRMFNSQDALGWHRRAKEH